MRSFSVPDRLVGWILPVAAIVAEGALLAVIYVAVQTTIDQRPPLLGTLELSVAAGTGAMAVRRGWLDPDAQLGAFLALLAGLGIIGWTWDAAVRDALSDGRWVDALALHPGGWLMVAAGMRGVGRGLEIDDRAVTRLVLIGVPLLAVPWALGQVAAGDLRDTFTEHAFVASMTFVTAGFIAAGLARLQEIGRETGVDWRHDRSWLGTVLGVLLVVVALGVPSALVLGLPGSAVARGILDPILALLGYAFVAVASLAALLAAILAGLLKSIGVELPPPMTPDEIARLPEMAEVTFEQVRGALTALAVVWVAMLVLAVVVLRVWLRRTGGRSAAGTTEERSIRIPGRSFRLRPPRLPAMTPRPRRGTPGDAVGAYLAALDELAAHDPTRARAEHETPRGHARRVDAGPELTALQADYALARYGSRDLSPAEHRRAVSRWRRLRARLRAMATTAPR